MRPEMNADVRGMRAHVQGEGPGRRFSRRSLPALQDDKHSPRYSRAGWRVMTRLLVALVILAYIELRHAGKDWQ
jgi:hypothetical protein